VGGSGKKHLGIDFIFIERQLVLCFYRNTEVIVFASASISCSICTLQSEGRMIR
jgi:hypothetical protein